MRIRPCGLLVRERRVLFLVYGEPGRERYNLPGGSVEGDETIHECLERELAEELGIRGVPGGLVVAAETAARRPAVLHLVLAIAEFHGEPRLNPQQTTARSLIWMETERLTAEFLYPSVGSSLQSWLSGGGLGGAVFLGRIAQPWRE